MEIHLPIKIAGLGRYLPERVVPSSELERLCDLPAGWVEKRNGVRERRWVTDETSSYMGAQAAREALDEAGLKPAGVDLILSAAATTEQAIPDTAALIQRQLGLGSSGIPCMSIHSTCLSFLSALDIAANLLATGRCKSILIVSSEIGSCGVNLAEAELASLLGDAAAAAVVMRSGPGEPQAVHRTHMKTYGEGAYTTVIMGVGSARHPNRPTTKPEDNLFHMDGPAILRLVSKVAPAFLDELYPGLSTGLLDIDAVVPHQASKTGLELLTRFGWPRDRVVRTLEWLGNCAAASIPATLYEAVRGHRIERGSKVLLVGTGAGLSLGGIVLTY